MFGAFPPQLRRFQSRLHPVGKEGGCPRHLHRLRRPLRRLQVDGQQGQAPAVLRHQKIRHLPVEHLRSDCRSHLVKIGSALAVPVPYGFHADLCERDMVQQCQMPVTEFRTRCQRTAAHLRGFHVLRHMLQRPSELPDGIGAPLCGTLVPAQVFQFRQSRYLTLPQFHFHPRPPCRCPH